MTGELGVLLLGSAPEHGLSASAVETGHVFAFPSPTLCEAPPETVTKRTIMYACFIM